MAKKGDYEVGRGKTPKHTRFKPGQSGNPNGRPKGARNLRTDLMEELAEQVDVKIGGKPRRISQQRMLIKALINRGAKKSDPAASKIFDLYFKVLRLEDGADEAGEPFTKDELEVLRNLEARILEKAQNNSTRNKGSG